MAANKNWTRWIFASISKHFLDYFTAEGVTLFIEGQHRDTDTLQDFVELRIDGPRLTEVSKDCWLFRVEVNILITSIMNDTNYYRVQQNVGISQAGCIQIDVFKFGDGVDDDGSFLGCFKLLQDKASRDFLEANQFGQIDVATKILQATVEAHYKMLLQI